MRYIRTKDKIIDLNAYSDLPCNEFFDEHLQKKVYDFNSQGRFIVEKEADVIKDLCDAYVATKDGIITCTFFQKFWDYDQLKNIVLDNDLYACIWVFDSNGVPTLKPVAKMNFERRVDKRKLELL